MRTIDADNLKADLKKYFTDGVLDGISAKLAFNQIMHDIDNASTVEFEVAEKFYFDEGYKQGTSDAINAMPTDKWIQKCDDNFDWYECSCCGYGNEGELQERPWFKFCPSCGSRMED